jgi:fluoroquinolone transport system permease protein
MTIVRVLGALGPMDATGVKRDPLLRWMVILPLAISLPARWLLPMVIGNIERLLNVQILPYYPAVMSYALLALSPLLVGMVIGFLLLDQRDDRTLTALQVTPLPLRSYLLYRLGAPMVVSMAITLIALPLSGLIALDSIALLLAVIAAAPLAPLSALTLSTFAENKVQGLALSKGTSFLMAIPIAALFVPPLWQIPLAIVPTTWPAMTLWTLAAGDPAAIVFAIGGLLYHALLIGLLLRRWQRVMYG